MDSKPEKKYLIIHGHFYQPPRENPWTERIDRQPSASPYHDWNERITSECYRPNTCSRRLDWYGRINRITNNYRSISFNFGPTIFSWLEANDPETYSAILEADRESVEKYDGHGNAIAQVYNHIIMPLADRADQETQIRWGMGDFLHRFGREPEGIWLAETAINETTLEILIDFGFRFIILAPHQAARIRPLDRSTGWKNVSDGSVATGFPYRCFGRRRPGRRKRDRYIDIFFYDSPLANDISFNHLLRDGEAFADAIEAAYPRCGNDLVIIASDGEVYGHHEPFADMALAYLIEKAAPEREIEMVNPAWYLDHHQPTMEVQIKRGSNGEGTAWSCAHGVGRWKEDCGCSTGGPPEWNQKWRKPLREGLNELRDQIRVIMERECGNILEDPYQARDDYINVIRERSDKMIDRFISGHTSREITPVEKSTILSQMEAQRHAMLMFTSCGWFFNDISGLETVQILKYAGRAIQLAGDEKTQKHLRNTLLDNLYPAQSNIPEKGTGETVYRQSMDQAAVDYPFFAFQYMVNSFYLEGEESTTIFGHHLKKIRGIERELENFRSRLYLVELVCRYTLEKKIFNCLLMIEENSGATCLIGESGEAAGGDYQSPREREKFQQVASLMEESPPGISTDELSRKAKGFLPCTFTLDDLFREEKEEVVSTIISDTMEQSMDSFREIYENVRDRIMLIRQHHLDPPHQFLVPAEIYLEHRLSMAGDKLARRKDQTNTGEIEEIIAEADKLAIPVDRGTLCHTFTELIAEGIRTLSEETRPRASRAFLYLVDTADRLSIPLDDTVIQNEICLLLTVTIEPIIESVNLEELSQPEREALEDVLELSGRFNFNLDRLRDYLGTPGRETEPE